MTSPCKVCTVCTYLACVLAVFRWGAHACMSEGVAKTPKRALKLRRDFLPSSSPLTLMASPIIFLASLTHVHTPSRAHSLSLKKPPAMQASTHPNNKLKTYRHSSQWIITMNFDLWQLFDLFLPIFWWLPFQLANQSKFLSSTFVLAALPHGYVLLLSHDLNYPNLWLAAFFFWFWSTFWFVTDKNKMRKSNHIVCAF